MEVSDEFIAGLVVVGVFLVSIIMSLIVELLDKNNER